MGLEHLDSLLKLVQFQGDLIILLEDVLDMVLHLDQLLYIFKLFFLLLGTFGRVDHELVPLLRLLVELLLHEGGGQVVVLGVVVVSVEVDVVGGSSNVDEVALIIFESHLCDQ